MKRFLLVIFFITGFAGLIHAQQINQIGIGYFGHTLSHPGVVVEWEMEKMQSENISIPIRIDLGFYHHPRHHNALFLDVNAGFRQYFKSRFFLEESIGIGLMQTILNGEDGVFEVDESGNVTETSKFNQPDLMPSLSLGLGWDLTKNKDKQTLLWVRPKVFWQYPQKQSAVYNISVQAGLSFQISK